MNLPTRLLSVGASGTDVAAIHRALRELGFAIPATDQRASKYGKGTQQAVSQFQVARGLHGTGTLDAATAAELADAVAQSTYVVAGTVSSPVSASVGALDVQIVDRNIGEDVVVGATTTDVRGRYQAAVVIADDVLRKRRKTRPDLQARVLSGSTFLTASDVAYNAAPSVTLDVELPGDASLPSEYETLAAAVATVHAGSPAALREDDERQDVTYLANKTGWDARAVALLASAAQFGAAPAPARARRSRSPAAAETGGIRPELYYALFRAGLPASADTLYRASAATVESIWKQAIAQNVIPPSLAPVLPAALAAYSTLSATATLRAKPVIGLSPLADMLQRALPEPAQQQQFAELHAQFSGDSARLWAALQDKFGAEAVKRLQLDGQLGYMTLNNAALMTALHKAEQRQPLAATVDLAQRGYYDAGKWQPLIGDAIPEPIPGESADDRRANYAELLAAQVRIAFPTLVVADRVRNGGLPVKGGSNVASEVAGFLTSNHGSFEIGTEPVEAYLARSRISGTPAPVIAQVKRLQRVYQLTPDDRSMTALLQADLDSAAAIVRYQAADFVQTFAGVLGSPAIAADIHERARQIHGSVLAVVTHYLGAQRAPVLGGASQAPILNPRSSPRADAPYPVVAYPTLEALFGSMDYCACEECRSILSPAAYLVDLLHFLDCPSPHAGFRNPQAALLDRRPDLQHLQLTCANTNTALPYIDLVNETLEHFVAHGQSLADFEGFNTTDAMSSAELLAAPQNVDEAAYGILQNAFFPPPLPFHRALALLRLHLDAIGVPLHEAMAALRASDAVERASPQGFGWRDILMERIGLSREEYRVLTDSTLGLRGVYGYPALAESDALARLQDQSLQEFARRLNLGYEDLLALVQTRFFNPNSALIALLQQLHMPFATLQKLKDGALSLAEFEALLPAGIDARSYGAAQQHDPAAIAAWITTQFARIMAIIAYANPADPSDVCASDKLVLRYTNPDSGANRLHGTDFLKLLRLVRLWRKLGLRIGEVDDLIGALYPPADVPTGGNEAADLQRLDAGFLSLLPRVGFLYAVRDLLHLGNAALPSLLACWAPIDTTGADSLYASNFLSPTLLLQDRAFAADGTGRFLQDGTQKLLAHEATLCAAFHLTGAEFDLVTAALGFDATTTLSLDNVSAVYRFGWLARALRLSVAEFIALRAHSGLDPFASLDPGAAAPAEPQVARFIRLVQALRDAGLQPVQALYLFWNRDLNGKATPPDSAVTALAGMLRAAYAAVDSQFKRVDDPDGTIARRLMALVYGAAATDFFFGLLNNTLVSTASYANAAGALAQPILDAASGRLSYDDLRKQLAFGGVLDAAAVAAIDAAITANGNDAQLHAAVATLATTNRAAVEPFFAKYPELEPLYAAYAASGDPLPARRTTLLASVLPAFREKRKQEQALASVSSIAGSDPGYASALLQDASVLHAQGQPGLPAQVDFTAIEAQGLAAEFHLTDDAATPPETVVDVVERIDYSPGGTALPAGQGGGAITALWRGYLDAPQDGFYEIAIVADATADVSLSLGGQPVTLAASGGVWANQSAIALKAGELRPIELRIAHAKTRATLRWRTQGLGWQVVPGAFLYSRVLVDRLRSTYLRFLKTTAIASALALRAREVASLGTDASHAGSPPAPAIRQGWLNFLPVDGAPDAASASALREVLVALLDYAALKAAYAVVDERLLAIVEDPGAVNEDGSLALASTTGWSPASVRALLQQFFGDEDLARLADLSVLRRVHDAYRVVAMCRVPAATLLVATTNAPDASAVSALQSALRGRYATADWRNVVQPINDAMRQAQRDALVAHILQQLGDLPPGTPPSPDDLRNIDTPEKLYEHLLIDPQTEPAVRTSRIRLALSAVQLFVERCLRNLEPQVSGADIGAAQWTWMKRFRVWQANREVFLWPENWLYPELRDDQSPLFRRTMSALTQSDISDDLAETAYLDYLSRLEGIAKLEPCGLYYIPGEAGKTNESACAVARTAGTHRKYYFRQLRNGSWTPWTEMKVDPDDLPVTPIVWKDRLLVFWLRLLKQTPVEAAPPPPPAQDTGPVTSLSIGQIQGAASSNVGQRTQVTFSAVLCWSEYYNGKWQPTKTSDTNRPTLVATHDSGDNALEANRCLLRLEPTELTGDMAGALLLRIVSPVGNARGGFVLYNTHSLPVRVEEINPTLPLVSLFAARRSFSPVLPYTGGSLALVPVPFIWPKPDYSTFTIDYSSGLWVSRLPHQTNKILKPLLVPRYVAPQAGVPDVWNAPFFYEDRKHVFYVTTTQAMVTVRQFGGFGLGLEATGALADVTIPPIVLPPRPKVPDVVAPVRFGSTASASDPFALQEFVAADSTIRMALGSTMTVTYQGQEIGAKGRVGAPSANQGDAST